MAAATPSNWVDTLIRLPLPFTNREWWAWFDAWEHIDLIELITIHANPPQLTTGCTCRDTPRWYPSRPADRNCPAHGWPRPAPLPTERCTCIYGLRPTLWNPTHLIDVPGVGQRGAAFTFRLDPFCPHHGEPSYVGTLDENERRGH